MQQTSFAFAAAIGLAAQIAGNKINKQTTHTANEKSP